MNLPRKLPDICEYYMQGDLHLREEEAWIREQLYMRNVQQLNDFINLIGAKSIIEFGCGSGWIPFLLHPKIEYLGVDNNPLFLNLARKKNPETQFLHLDLRNYVSDRIYDLSTCWAFLKHFSVDEVSDIAGIVLRNGKYSTLEVNISDTDFDDGVEFHHSFITEHRLRTCLSKAKHQEMYRIRTWKGETEQGFPFEVYTIFTRNNLYT